MKTPRVFQCEKDRAELAAIVGRNGIVAVVDALSFIILDIGARWSSVRDVCDRDAQALTECTARIQRPLAKEDPK